ncbi:complex I subunit 5 family protein [Pelotomaculum propionicicum]|uniref:Na(+)/H(+) antiporter subunit A n=1 Tax=Pelotomaculum propionicicum TaxID=258475 RepID=A0A4Y7RSU6_9FIRM|nr:proton-conducting transporter membrane subunit [Pelotomaculum propionicicum]TEB11826.1 Na(+)/H(+) antiporter subunit A [Pelotomaculum propionicicum]
MESNSVLPWLIIGVPALAAGAEVLLGRKRPQSAGLAAIAGVTITLGLVLVLAGRVVQGEKLIAWNGQLYADGLSALVTLVIGVAGLAATVFSYRYLRNDVAAGKTVAERLPFYFSLDALFICTMLWATLTNNLIMLYVVVEATTLASALLVTFYWKRESLEAGFKYLLLCTVGITFALLGCVLIYAAASPHVGGHQAMLITALAPVVDKFPRELTILALAFLVVGFGTKAGLVPFHAWLPDAYSQAPVSFSALLSIGIKVAAYALARVLTIFYPEYSTIGLLVVVLGMVTMLSGIVFAFAQDDLKRMLAFSSVRQIGYVMMGLGLGSSLGYFGALYHFLNHALLKAMLFLCTGALVYTSGTTLISQLRGRKEKGALTAICFFTGALAIGGMPPLNGFWSKFTIFIATAQAGLWWATGVAVFTSLLTLACLVRAGYLVFLEREEATGEETAATAGHGGCTSSSPEPAQHHPAAEPPWSMLGMMLALAAACILIGLLPGPVNRLIAPAVQSIMYIVAGG